VIENPGFTESTPQIAGVEDAPPQKKSAPKEDWSRQLEKVYSSAGGGSGGGGGSRSDSRGGNPMVKVVGYDSPAQPSGYGSQGGKPREGYGREGYGQRASQPEYGDYGSSLSQSNISGISTSSCVWHCAILFILIFLVTTVHPAISGGGRSRS
jgi:hypothetical protein